MIKLSKPILLDDHNINDSIKRTTINIDYDETNGDENLTIHR